MIINKIFRPKATPTNQSQAVADNIKRSLLKTISWRIIGTLDTILISWAITGTLTLAFSIGFIELVTKMVLYFFHERAWSKINLGR
ncbi:MAG: DUF2061 domain-containing protein [Flavobacteriaceae bacterium]|nr:DUF2061 domain-containing protein [Flavobacteriaceae bacterium]MDA7848812.1 DUF2061 domain-containing protein [Flavobacteriaceae bacterium]MDG1310087.1 DUF2061 domain-containing protein [Flavobacteriaceae bacterium]